MTAEKPSSAARRQRLARALKANIAKRKAQARAQAGGTAREADPAAAAPPAAQAAADEDGCPN